MNTTDRTEHVLGAQVRKIASDKVFKLKDCSYTRAEWLEKCAPYSSLIAPRRLQTICHELGVREVAHLATLNPEDLRTTKHKAGELTLWGAMCVLDDKGYSIPGWFGWGRTKDDVVTWRTISHRVERGNGKR